MDTTYEASEKPSQKRVRLINTVDTTKEGYPVCYNRDTTTGDSAKAVDFYRAYEVEKPTTANLKYFAGVIAAKSASIVGESAGVEITINVPTDAGVVCNVHTGLTCTLGTTKLALTGATWAFGAESAAATTWATAVQTSTNRTGTPGPVLAVLGNAETALVAATQGTLVRPTGGTTGATVGLVNVPGTGYSTLVVAAIEDNFTKIVTNSAQVTVDIAAIVTALKKKGIMSKA